MKRKAKTPAKREAYCIDIGPHMGFEYKWANPEMARHLYRAKEGWTRYYRGTGVYRGHWDLLRRRVRKPPNLPKTPKATRKDIVELHAQLTTWLDTHR